jgi:hypothetical protein
MSIYTIVFTIVTILVLLGLAAFGFLIIKIDKWVDKRERLGKESVYKNKPKTPKSGS